jgi:hypothetical protein
MKTIPCMYLEVPNGEELRSPYCTLSFSFPEYCKICLQYDYLEKPIDSRIKESWRYVNGNTITREKTFKC